MTKADTADEHDTTIIVAGATGDLGRRIVRALVDRGAHVRAIVRLETIATRQTDLEALGASVLPVDFGNAIALTDACRGAACVVSVLNGLRPIIIDTQGQLLDAAVAAGVPRFIPSDYSLDFTRTISGENRNLDLRREFMARLDTSPIRATSILNGAFADLLTGDAPIVLRKVRKILFWGRPDQPMDFTSKDDVARYVAAAALDPHTPRILRIAGDTVTAQSLADTMTALENKPYGLWRAGGIRLLGSVIRIARTLAPQRDVVFPVWQGMQYMRDMSSGRGKLDPLDNDRYGKTKWTSAQDVLAGLT